MYFLSQPCPRFPFLLTHRAAHEWKATPSSLYKCLKHQTGQTEEDSECVRGHNSLAAQWEAMTQQQHKRESRWRQGVMPLQHKVL